MYDPEKNETPASVDAEKGLWGRFGDKLWDLLPWAIPALAGAVITGGLAIRDASHGIVDLRREVDGILKHNESLIDCVKRPECEAVRALLAALDARLKAAETGLYAHEASANEWKARIVEVERGLRELVAVHNGKVSTQDLRALENRLLGLERYGAADEQRMRALEQLMERKR